jgi:hypothetical protein
MQYVPESVAQPRGAVTRAPPLKDRAFWSKLRVETELVLAKWLDGVDQRAP